MTIEEKAIEDAARAHADLVYDDAGDSDYELSYRGFVAGVEWGGRGMRGLASKTKKPPHIIPTINHNTIIS